MFFFFLDEVEGPTIANNRSSSAGPTHRKERAGGPDALSMWAIGSSRQCEKDEGLKSGKVSLVSRVRHEVSCQEENEQLKVEFGNWTSTITITNFDGIPTVTAAETKNVDLCPTARGGVGMPEVSFCVSACLNSRVILPES